jgi:hypothetical protein
MYAPAQHDEVTGLVNYIDQQLAAIRAAAFGLTEKQARETPRRSALCDFFQPYHPASGTLLA